MSEIPRKGVDSTVKQALGSSLQQAVAHSYFEREPSAKEVPEQGFVLATVSGTSYIYTRIGITRYRVALTAV